MERVEALQTIANRLRADSMRMTTAVGSGHPTTCMSMAELMAVLFFDEMQYNPQNPNDPGNDEFVLSKGHAAPILWSAYLEAGIIKEKELKEFRKIGSRLEGHPTPAMPWIRAATGSLGQGLSVGLGMAMAMQLQKVPGRVYVMLGDGESAEGSVWEAAELAAKYKSSNIVAILDANRLGQSGESLHAHQIRHWEEKFLAFGWHAIVVDGHNINEILQAFRHARSYQGPVAIIAKTFKGKGISFLENREGWHGKPLRPEQLEHALKELGSLEGVDAKSMVKRPKKVTLKKLKRKASRAPKYKATDMVATRQAFGTMLEKLGGDERVIALDADTKNSTFSEKFKNSYPNRFVECYIAEQNMVGVAAGFAAKSFVPVASTFGTFFTRAHDQIRMSGISRHNLKLVGSHVGVSIGEDGPSQMGLEDMALFRALPESIVLYPSDAVSAEKCTQLLVQHKGLGYLRTSRPKTPILYKNTDAFKIGRSKVLRKGGKVAIITAGVTLHEALKAAELLKKQRINITVIDAYSVKPLDARGIRAATKGKKVIVVEEHYPEGGLGEAVAALGIPITHLAVRGVPMSGSATALLRKFKLDAKAILNAVKKLR